MAKYSRILLFTIIFIVSALIVFGGALILFKYTFNITHERTTTTESLWVVLGLGIISIFIPLLCLIFYLLMKRVRVCMKLGRLSSWNNKQGRRKDKLGNTLELDDSHISQFESTGRDLGLEESQIHDDEQLTKDSWFKRKKKKDKKDQKLRTEELDKTFLSYVESLDPEAKLKIKNRLKGMDDEGIKKDWSKIGPALIQDEKRHKEEKELSTDEMQDLNESFLSYIEGLDPEQRIELEKQGMIGSSMLTEKDRKRKKKAKKDKKDKKLNADEIQELNESFLSFIEGLEPEQRLELEKQGMIGSSMITEKDRKRKKRFKKNKKLNPDEIQELNNSFLAYIKSLRPAQRLELEKQGKIGSSMVTEKDRKKRKKVKKDKKLNADEIQELNKSFLGYINSLDPKQRLGLEKQGMIGSSMLMEKDRKRKKGDYKDLSLSADEIQDLDRSFMSYLESPDSEHKLKKRKIHDEDINKKHKKHRWFRRKGKKNISENELDVSQSPSPVGDPSLNVGRYFTSDRLYSMEECQGLAQYHISNALPAGVEPVVTDLRLPPLDPAHTDQPEAQVVTEQERVYFNSNNAIDYNKSPMIRGSPSATDANCRPTVRGCVSYEFRIDPFDGNC